MHFSRPALLAVFATAANAYSATKRSFAVNRFYGKGPLVEGRMDPIVNPGVPSGHVHAIQGGNAFALSMTDDQPMKSTCTSSLVKADLSNYWTPSLYFQDPKTGKLESVKMYYMNVYYFMEPTTDTIVSFPVGLRIVTGNPTLRTPPKTGGSLVTDLKNGPDTNGIQWTCTRKNANEPLYPTNSDGLNGVGVQDPSNKGAGAGFPDKDCDGLYSPLRADITFPSCWNSEKDANGKYKYLDTFVNKGTISYPTDGKCPPGWSHLPKLFYEVYWETQPFKDRWTPGQGKQPFVLANGDPTGYGLHADFLSGWDEKILTHVINTCDTGSGGMDKCQGVGELNAPSTSCNIASPVQEVISGVMDKLPGDNPIGKWGENASAPPASGNPAPVPAPAPAPAPAPVPVPAPVPAPAPGTPATSVVGGNNPPSAPTSTTKQANNPPAATSGSNTLATSYVSETTAIQTTVTRGGDSPTPSKEPSTGTGSKVADGWSYTGCYQDAKPRVLTGVQFANVGHRAVTNTKCVDYCSAKGFKIAGTEYGGQCFCGNEFKAAKVDDSNCAVPCEGDESQKCGGSMTLSVYSNGTPKLKRSVRHAHARRHIHAST